MCQALASVRIDGTPLAAGAATGDALRDALMAASVDPEPSAGPARLHTMRSCRSRWSASASRPQATGQPLSRWCSVPSNARCSQTS